MAALSAPSSVSFSIQGDSVLVKWKHPRGEEPTHGYYVIVQEIQKKLRLDAPDFVHVDRNVMSVKIKGLKPAAAYEMKVQPEIKHVQQAYTKIILALVQVVAYSDERHEASKPIIVETTDLGNTLSWHIL